MSPPTEYQISLACVAWTRASSQARMHRAITRQDPLATMWRSIRDRAELASAELSSPAAITWSQADHRNFRCALVFALGDMINQAEGEQRVSAGENASPPDADQEDVVMEDADDSQAAIGGSDREDDRSQAAIGALDRDGGASGAEWCLALRGRRTDEDDASLVGESQAVIDGSDRESGRSQAIIDGSDRERGRS